MTQILLVGVGGCLGSVLRYLLGGLVQGATPGGFPTATLVVNVLGCLAIGLLSELAEATSMVSENVRVFTAIGILGGFTTFSSFGNETINLWRDGKDLQALGNIALQLVLGLGAVWLGRLLGHQMWR